MNKLIPLLCLLFTACAAPTVTLLPEADRITVGKGDPLDNYNQIGPVSGYDGDGCGAFGYLGTYERAVTDLKNKAFQIGTNYVQIITITEPHFVPGCFDNVYKISWTAYKKVRESPSPTPISTVSGTNTQKSLAEQLHELHQLRQEGFLTEEEYREQRKKVLNR